MAAEFCCHETPTDPDKIVEEPAATDDQTQRCFGQNQREVRWFVLASRKAELTLWKGSQKEGFTERALCHLRGKVSSVCEA